MSRGSPPLYRFVADRSGQSNPLAVVLLLGITLTGTGVIVGFGTTAVGETQAAADLGQAEQAMTQFDSRASLVAHGSADTQRTRVGTNGQGSIELDENAGRMRVEIVNESTGAVDDVVMNASMGAVVYERSGSTIAYQGGGVWRAEEEGSVMVSPPEFNYRGGTLTLPLVLVRGQAASGGNMILRQDGASTGLYPNASAGRANPLEKGSVNVTVTSGYYEAWGRYFAQRTAGDVTYDHPNETVEIELVVPFDEDFNNILATTQSGGITAHPGPPPSPSASGVAYPPADSRIESKIANCESGGCNSWTTTPSGPGTYYKDGDFTGGMSIDTSSGDVTLVVNGSVEFNAPVTVNSPNGNNVSLYVREDFAVSGGSAKVNQAPTNGTASRFRTYVHSTAYDGTQTNVDGNGQFKYVGLIYAPGSTVDLNGGGSPSYTNVKGGVVGDTVTINGNPNKFVYDSSIQNIALPISSSAPTILYLHVSTTEVEVDD